METCGICVEYHQVSLLYVTKSHGSLHCNRQEMFVNEAMNADLETMALQRDQGHR